VSVGRVFWTQNIRATLQAMRRLCLILAVFVTFSPWAGAAPTPAKRPTVAIMLFDYGGKAAELEPLREGLAQMLISDLSGIPQVQIVERARLKDLLAEQKLGRSGKLDSATTARVGKLLGARLLVLGSYFDLGANIRVDARVVEVETGKVIRAAAANGPAVDFWTIEQELAGKLGNILGEALPDIAPAKLPARPRPPQMKTTVVATYGQALAALDAGQKSQAKALLAKVVEDAPGFTLAKSDLNALLQ